MYRQTLGGGSLTRPPTFAQVAPPGLRSWRRQVIKQRRVRRQDDGVLSLDNPLVRFQAAQEREQLRVPVQSAGQEADGFRFTFTAYAVGLLLGFGQNNVPVPVRGGANFAVFLFTFGAEAGGDTVTLGPHPGVNRGGNRFGEVCPLDANVNHPDAEVLPLCGVGVVSGDSLHFQKHFVKNLGTGFLSLNQREAFIVNNRDAKFVNQGPGADDVGAVAQGDPVAQGGSYDVAKAAAGVAFGLQGLAELHRVGDAIAGINVNHQVFLVLVGH